MLCPAGAARPQPGLVRFLPYPQRIVEHNTRTAERPCQGLTLAGRRVEAEVVPELHPLSITGGSDIALAGTVLHPACARGFRHQVPAPGVHRSAPGPYGGDPAGCLRGPRVRA